MNELGLAGLPEGLFDRQIFVLWRLTWNGKRWTKPPMQANGHPASVKNSGHWLSLDAALSVLDRSPGEFDGLGIVLTAGLRIVGIDSDYSRSVDTGAISSEAADLCRRFTRAYTEISPSGTGIRLLVTGTYEATRHKVNLNDGRALEMYANERYLTLTGHRLRTAASLARNNPNHDYSIELQVLHDEVFAPAPVANHVVAANMTKRPLGKQSTAARSDEAIIQGFVTGSNVWFRQAGEYYYSGIPAGADASRIEFHLIRAILRANNGDEVQADRIFRKSAIYQDQSRAQMWDSARGSITYGWYTIRNAKAGGRDS